MAKNENVADLAQRRAADVLRDTDRDSVGLVRILSDSAGTAGDVREYEEGDEALVEAGRAEWVVAPVHLPSAGRRLDTDAGREAVPADGVEAFPPADGDPLRESEARRKGYVEAHTNEGLGERLAGKRAEVARTAARREDEGDAKTQAALGGFGARSGPVSNSGNLTPADLVEGESALTTSDPAAGREASGDQPAKKAAPAKSAQSKES